MKKAGLLIVMISLASTAQADLFEARQADGVRSFSDRTATTASATRHNRAITNPLKAEMLPGVWHATSHDGRRTELQLKANGSFVFDQTSDNTRLYMCGMWEGSTSALQLTVNALKQQHANGDIEQTTGSYSDEARILTAQRDRIIVRLNGETLVFDRS